jgi:hypothetical protein
MIEIILFGILISSCMIGHTLNKIKDILMEINESESATTD